MNAAAYGPAGEWHQLGHAMNSDVHRHVEAAMWIAALEFLSLDVVRLFYYELGLDVPQHETLRGIIRDALSGRFRATEPTVQNRWVSVAHRSFECDIGPALTVLERALGTEVRQRLKHWVRYVYSFDNNPWTPYHCYLLEWGGRIRRGQPDQVGFRDPRRLAELVRERTRSDDIEMLVGRQQPSEWDQAVLGSRGYEDISSGPIYSVLSDQACNVVRQMRFQRFFREMIDTMSEDERHRLERAVSDAAGRSGTFATISDLEKL